MMVQKKILGQKLLKMLINISLTTCDAQNYKNFDRKVQSLAIKSLCSLAGNFSRRIYIPGETSEKQKIRNYFICQSGLLALLTISVKAIEEYMRNLPNLEIYGYLEQIDWEFQREIIEKFKNVFNFKLKNNNLKN